MSERACECCPTAFRCSVWLHHSVSACCIWSEQTLYKREIKMRKEKRMNGSTAEKDIKRKRMSVLAGI